MIYYGKRSDACDTCGAFFKFSYVETVANIRVLLHALISNLLSIFVGCVLYV